jgi:hypothetical protein
MVDYEGPHYAVFFILVLHPSILGSNILLSTLLLKTLLLYVLLISEAKPLIHTKQQVKL